MITFRWCQSRWTADPELGTHADYNYKIKVHEVPLYYYTSSSTITRTGTKLLDRPYVRKMENQTLFIRGLKVFWLTGLERLGFGWVTLTTTLATWLELSAWRYLMIVLRIISCKMKTNSDGSVQDQTQRFPYSLNSLQVKLLTPRNLLFVNVQSSRVAPSTIQLSQTSKVWFTNTNSNFLFAFITKKPNHQCPDNSTISNTLWARLMISEATPPNGIIKNSRHIKK